MTNHSGFLGTATFNGVELPVKGWSVRPRVRIATSDNSKTSGFEVVEQSGGLGCDFTVNFDFDFDSNAFASAPNIIIGSTITNVKLYLRTTSGLFWNFPSAVVIDTPMDASRTSTDMIGGSVTCRSNGTFSYPGAVAPTVPTS